VNIQNKLSIKIFLERYYEMLKIIIKNVKNIFRATTTIRQKIEGEKSKKK
jgi:hypothetical protein